MLKYLENKISSQLNQLITYAQFIEIALYHPHGGYYMNDRAKIGKKGDFITTSNVHDVYGRIIAKWYAALVNEYQLEPKVCELGAGNGRFAKAFIDGWNEFSEQPLAYFIVETSPFHRKLQKEILPVGKKVKQVSSMEELAPFSGLVFSNELFDALPVHVVKKKSGKLFEVMVGFEDGQLIEKDQPLQNKQISMFLEKYQLDLSEGQRIEIPLQMENLIANLAKTIESGLVVTVDYGYTGAEWMDPARKNGSLRGFYEHQLMDNVLQHVGQMDITSHVHFDALIQQGEEQGLTFISKQRQDEFLLATGILNELRDHVDSNPFSEVSRRNRAIRSLIMPAGMSGYFHVITQQKGIQLTDAQLFQQF